MGFIEDIGESIAQAGEWASNFEITLPFVDEIFKMIFTLSQPTLALLVVIAYTVLWAVVIGIIVAIARYVYSFKDIIKDAIELFENELQI